MIILNGSKSTSLGEKIAHNLGIQVENVSTRIFPDGEYYIRITNQLKGKETFIIQTMFPDPNDSLMELLLISDTVKDMGASKITGIIPYSAYARQDKRFQPGEALSVKTVVNLLKSVGVEYLITIDTHYRHVGIGEFDLFGIPCYNLSACRILLRHIEKEVEKEFLTIGPDFGSSGMVEYATGEVQVLKKEKRCPNCGLPVTQCQCENEQKEYVITDLVSEIDFSGKNVVILNDIIASGRTMIKAVEKVKSEGARKVIVAATHGLFLKDSLRKLQEMTDYLVVTDSISTTVSNVSVEPLIVEVMK